MLARVAPRRRSSQARSQIASRFGDALGPGLVSVKSELTSRSRAKSRTMVTRAGVKMKPFGDLIGSCGLRKSGAGESHRAGGPVNQVAGTGAQLPGSEPLELGPN